MKHQSSTLAVPEISAVPRHVAIIMDGNGRWATKRFLPRVAGHAKGVDAVRDIVEACAVRGIEFLTLFAFSSENWRRPADEVSVLMRLFMTVLEREVGKMAVNGIRLKIVGDMSRFDPKLQEMALRAETQTASNTRLTLTVCANYGGRWDIMQAVGKMARAHPGQTDFSEEQLAPYLAMAYAPEPDLFIRTGGEQRISNFLLWQLAYSELYFTDTFWPDFNGAALDLAIASYQQRERRFGRTSAQVLDQKKGFLMLKTRVITALILLAILLPILYFDFFPAFAVAVLVFFAAGAWECFRLFKSPRPAVWAAVWTLAFAVIVFFSGLPSVRPLYVLCVVLWVLRFVPALGVGLPPTEAFANRLLNGTYMLAILGCFVAIVDLFARSPLYLLSVMAVVWVADIGAYFAGKGFGRHKLAPSISPGKSWEGAVGGWMAVLVISAAVAMAVGVGETFQFRLFQRWGWLAFVALLSVMVAASVVGDLFESQLKRRAGMKDSSNLLPGHGGVLDRIDALIPVLPLAALIDLWLAAS